MAESRKSLRNRYRKGDSYGRSWCDNFGLPLSFKQWLLFGAPHA